ncbi:SigE family RNA polymerase sigma factor [Actinoplanes sp. URMC 104]|uniref:SigE family RNA polymerase sigma factor n=1 Tax=Actinoplanes sp. URMC 104 TaxID=3423409 RepID=UPI003F1B295E
MARGPGAGFDDFVRSRSTGLLRVAYLLTGDRHAAEDLLQEVLEQMYVRWRRIEHTPEAYARRALVNRATNRWRSRARRPETPLGRHHEQPGPDHGDDVAIRAAVLEALRELPPKQRAAVVLRYLEDLPVHEVAAALGCTDGTVKSNAARGLDRLKQVLGSSLVTDGGGR